MANKTFINLPSDIEDPAVKRFLAELIEKLDVAFGIRGSNTGFVTDAKAQQVAVSVFNNDTFSNVKKYDKNYTINSDRQLVHKSYVDSNFTFNEQQTDITNPAYTKTNPGTLYDQADSIDMDNGIYNLTSTVNEILTALRNASILGA